MFDQKIVELNYRFVHLIHQVLFLLAILFNMEQANKRFYRGALWKKRKFNDISKAESSFYE